MYEVLLLTSDRDNGGKKINLNLKKMEELKWHMWVFCIHFFDGVVQNTQHEFLFASSDLFS
jgi:hypothetical protein